MANPRSRHLLLIGATVLTAGVPVLAATNPEKAPEVTTMVPGPAGPPTPAEIAKLEAITAAPAAAPAPDVAPVMAPVLPKPAEITTIVIGLAGLTSQELAKIAAPVAPAPAPTTPAPASAPAPTAPTPAPAEK